MRYPAGGSPSAERYKPQELPHPMALSTSFLPEGQATPDDPHNAWYKGESA